MITLRSIRCPADTSGAARVQLPGTNSLCAHETIRVFGPNGVGKTTLLRIIAGVESDFSGRLEVESTLQIRLIPTNIMDLLLPWYSVAKNAHVMLHHVDHSGGLDAFNALLGQFLPGEVDRLNGLSAHLLSAGEKAAIACACALASKANVIILDETLSYMAPPLSRRVVPALAEFASSGGTLLVVGHYLPEEMIPTRDIVLGTGDGG